MSKKASKVAHTLENLLFQARWILSPLYVGLVFALIALIYRFILEFIHLIQHLGEKDPHVFTLDLLALLDLTLIGNLILIVILAGYENFVSKINTKGHEDRPEWMGQVDFSSLKIKVIASIVAISAIELLKSFVNLSILLKTGGDTPAIWSEADQAIAWKVGIHVGLVITGLLFAYMDSISERTHALKHKGNGEH